jgi:hypothetical protein
LSAMPVIGLIGCVWQPKSINVRISKKSLFILDSY